tara:strand:+ start:816 stop:1001 length:186 start_codon:yes stop_codon:yes gene_type:complete
MSDEKEIKIKRDEKDDDIWWVVDQSAEDNVVKMIRCNSLTEAQREAEKIAGFEFVLKSEGG